MPRSRSAPLVPGLLSACLLAGCSGAPPPPRSLAADLGAASVVDVLRADRAARVYAMPRSASEVQALAAFRCLVVLEPVAAGAAVPDEATLAALRAYVRGGGGLLLLGFAARLVHAIGIESRAPDRVAVYRWGVDDRTALGDYRFGFRLEGAERDETALCGALSAHAAGGGRTFLLGGGELCTAQTCHWERAPPADGEVLGRLARVRDGEFMELDAVVLARWRDGGGTVLALGNLPEPWRADDEVSGNARRFLDAAVDSLLGGSPGPVAVLVGEAEDPPSTREPGLPPLRARALPGRSAVVHWGLAVAASDRPGGEAARSPKAVFEQVILPAHRAGADLFDLKLADSERGYPLRWSPMDPLRRPDGFFGDGFWSNWSTGQVRLLAGEAHRRGALLLLRLEPEPVRGGGPAEQLAATKWLGRELLDLRRFGEGAADGIGVRAWFQDPDGLTRDLLLRYQPDLSGYQLRPWSAPVGGLCWAVDAELGRPRGIEAAGVSAQWRDVFPALAFPAAELDCRARRPPLGPSGASAARGGGSYGDWIVTQADDFIGRRLGTGAVLWWQGLDPATLGPDTLRYVYGVSMAPLCAAVAGRLWATGQGGYRDLSAARLPRVQGGFGAESPLPAETPFLQNNHFRLHGTGGPLWFDPSGTARFRLGAGSPVRALAPRRFLATRVGGLRPSTQSLRREVVDFVGGYPRGEGGYTGQVAIGPNESPAGRFPAALACDDAPRWPSRVEVEFDTLPGRYELELSLLGRLGDGLVEVRLDGELLGLCAFEVGEGSVTHRVSVPLGRPGPRRLGLEVVGGGAVTMSACRIARVDDSAGESTVGAAAGHFARLVESTWSSYFAESVELRTVADLPGFLWTAECRSAAANAEVVRTFGLERHRLLRASTAGEDSSALRLPFVLGSADPGLPDVAVVPLALPRDHRFRLTADGTLELGGYLRPHEVVRVGFLLLRDDTAEDLAAFRQVFAALAEPAVVTAPALPAEPALHSDLPLTWVRPVRVDPSLPAPFFVREGGFWLFRGGQVAEGGGHWLRVYQVPGHDVAIVPFESAGALLPARPGPGSLHSVALGELPDGRVTVDVLAVSPMSPAPSIVLREPLDEVELDGAPWSYFAGRRVFLPAAAGRYQVSARAAGGAVGRPHMRATRAVVRRCSFDAERRVLEVFTTRRPEDGEGTFYTALFTGPRPVEVRGGTIVPDEELTYPDASELARARTAGVVVRFRAGVLRLRYE